MSKNLNQFVFISIIIVVVVMSSCNILNNEDVNIENDEGIISLDVGNKYIFKLEQYWQGQNIITYPIDSIISEKQYNGNTYYQRSAVGWFRADNERVYIKCYDNIDSDEYLYFDYSVDVNDTDQRQVKIPLALLHVKSYRKKTVASREM